MSSATQIDALHQVTGAWPVLGHMVAM